MHPFIPHGKYLHVEGFSLYVVAIGGCLYKK